MSHASALSEKAKSVAFVDLKAQYTRLKPKIDARVRAVLDHGQFILGPEVRELEEKLAEYAGCADAVCVSSGTDALLVALMAEGVGPGDAVFLPAFTFPATAEVVLLVGATPVFVDVDERTFNIDPDDLKSKIITIETSTKLKPRAVIPVDLFGLPADYASVTTVANRHGLFLLADAAQSFGASSGGERVGTLAPVTAVSFFPAKPLGCYGDGGAILVRDAERAGLLRSIRAHGRGDGKFDIERVGINGRLDTLQAAILLAKLEVFAEEIEAREKLARHYDHRLAELVTVPVRPDGTRSAWAQYTITLDDRDGLSDRLRRQEIPTAIYYPRPMHLQPAYARFGDGHGSLPVSERLSETVLSLPMHPYMDRATTERICDVIERALDA